VNNGLLGGILDRQNGFDGNLFSSKTIPVITNLGLKSFSAGLIHASGTSNFGLHNVI